MSNIEWDRVQKGLEREGHKMIWRPYALPAVVDPESSPFVVGDVQPPWPVPDKLIVSVALTGAFFTPDNNPGQPISTDQILEQARACARAGASTLHVHVRDDKGYNTLSAERFRAVVDPIRDEFPDMAVDGCLVAAVKGEWDQMLEVLDAKLLDGVPINTTATYIGDALFAKPIPVILEKTRLVREAGAKPILAVYTDADVGNAERYLLRSGLVEKPSYWIVLPALPGCSPMDNPRQMFDGLLRISSAIYDCDPDATILVCAAGRASMYLVTIAAALGLHIRVGMEDTVWKWPHRNDRVESNVQMLGLAQALAGVLGREIASPAEYRSMVGLPEGPAVEAA